MALAMAYAATVTAGPPPVAAPTPVEQAPGGAEYARLAPLLTMHWPIGGEKSPRFFHETMLKSSWADPRLRDAVEAYAGVRSLYELGDQVVKGTALKPEEVAKLIEDFVKGQEEELTGDERREAEAQLGILYGITRGHEQYKAGLAIIARAQREHALLWCSVLPMAAEHAGPAVAGSPLVFELETGNRTSARNLYVHNRSGRTLTNVTVAISSRMTAEPWPAEDAPLVMTLSKWPMDLVIPLPYELAGGGARQGPPEPMDGALVYSLWCDEQRLEWQPLDMPEYGEPELDIRERLRRARERERLRDGRERNPPERIPLVPTPREHQAHGNEGRTTRYEFVPRARPHAAPETTPAPISENHAEPRSGPSPSAATAAAQRQARGWMTLADNFLAASMPEKAREYWQRVVEKHPGSPEAERARAMLEETEPK